MGEDDGAGGGGVGGKEAPVDVGAVADVGVVGLGCGEGEGALNEGLGYAWGGALEVEFYDSGEDLQLDL